MACRSTYKNFKLEEILERNQKMISVPMVKDEVKRLLFGVDSKFSSKVLLQNNLDMYEWVLRNKTYPNFWGKNINGENALTKEEVECLHSNACKIAPYYNKRTVFVGGKQTCQSRAYACVYVLWLS